MFRVKIWLRVLASVSITKSLLDSGQFFNQYCSWLSTMPCFDDSINLFSLRLFFIKGISKSPHISNFCCSWVAQFSATIAWCFYLTGLFSGDHTRLCRFPQRSGRWRKHKPGGRLPLCFTGPIRSYLPSRRASMLAGGYNIILLRDRSMYVWVNDL